MHINLLPFETQRRSLMRRLLKRWMLFSLAGSAVAALWLGAEYWQLDSLRQRVASERQAAQHLHDLAAEVHELRAKAQASESSIAAYEGLYADDHAVQLLGMISRSAQAAEGGIQLQRMNFQLAQSASTKADPAPNAAKTNAPKPPASELAIDGIAEDTAAVARFIAGLRNTGVFQRVDLKASSGTAAASGGSRTFSVDCQF